MACASDAYREIKNNRTRENDTIFRKYGGTNLNEFLSVCIEHYFESPGEIKEKYPLLYYATGILLNQCSSGDRTKVGIRSEFFAEQNKFLPGITKHTMRSHFLRHWTFKLWGFVSAVLIYNIATGNLRNPITLAIFLMIISIYLWYDYNAVKIEFGGKEIQIEKGSILFKNRKREIIVLSQLISLRNGDEGWDFIYYNIKDAFFHQEKVNPPKGVNETFFEECRCNKIAVSR